MASVIPMSLNLLALYPVPEANVLRPASEPMLMMKPSPESLRCRSAALDK